MNTGRETKTALTAKKLQSYLTEDIDQPPQFTDSQGFNWFNLSLSPDKPIIREKTSTDTDDTSLINLEKEFIFYVAHKINTFNETIKEHSDAVIKDKKFKEILFGQTGQTGQEGQPGQSGLIGSIQTKVQELSARNLSQQEKNLALDKLRKQIQKEADLALQVQFKLPHGTNATEFTERFNHNLENMPSFGKPITIIQKNPNNTVDVLETAQKTAHELEKGKDTTAKLSRYALEQNGQPALLYSTYRTDILVPHSKTFKDADDVELEQKKATVEKIKKIVGKFEGDSPIFYNLFTSIHSRFRIGEGNNEQTPRLKILLKAQDEYNLSLQSPEDVGKEKVGANYFFTLNIPTNGFGYEPSPDSFFSSEAKEMALRNDMAIAMILGDEPIKTALIKEYQGFLIAKPRPDFITGSRFEQAIKTEINNIKASLPTPSPENPFKTTLALLYKNNLHYKHEYARLTQTMAILCEDKSINGCKSGNERTAGILGRVEQAQDVKDKISEILQEGTDIQKAQKISQAIDKAYNDKGIYGISSDISLSDQGAVSKIETQLPYLSNLNPINWFKNIVRFFKNNIDTNRAEPWTIDNMQNSKTGSMQAHKVNGFNANFFSGVEKQRETQTPTTTVEVSDHSVRSLYTKIGQLDSDLKGIPISSFNSKADYMKTINNLETKVAELEKLSRAAPQQAETAGGAKGSVNTQELVQMAKKKILVPFPFNFDRLTCHKPCPIFV